MWVFYRQAKQKSLSHLNPSSPHLRMLPPGVRCISPLSTPLTRRGILVAEALFHPPLSLDLFCVGVALV